MSMPLRIAFVFLTRLPVAVGDVDAAAVGRSLAWYPVVGLAIGGAAAAVVGVAWDTPVLAAALAVAVLAGLSGALHLDGLADTADAWVGGLGDRARTLAIMKDPYCGPVGVVAIGTVLMVELAALASLVEAGHWLPVVVAGVLSRAVAPLLFLTTPYVRREGLGAALARHIDVTGVRLALGAALAVSLLAGWKGLFAVAVALVLVYALRAAFLRRLGGITGDTVGAAMVLTEALTLVVMALVS
ncbi:adenosylcobinamide-GDP ribazoletransferase [Arhodomonas sp. SL1]|uniref:adenosylcobinamide-GDP ribazoletransferase n=1 Tax=Arhodomonas sp. SL1 TaxID=3425691 RepID=UPI003F880D37